MDGDLDPLNGMYWAWNSGYINMKIEGITPKCQDATIYFNFILVDIKHLIKQHKTYHVHLKDLKVLRFKCMYKKH